MSDRIYYSREAEVRAQRERTMMAIVLLGFGVGVGAIMALLFAPRSGEEVRKDLTDRIETGAERARDVTNHTVENLQKDLSRLRDEMETRLQR
jgi:gas vesicle protein